MAIVLAIPPGHSSSGSQWRHAWQIGSTSSALRKLVNKDPAIGLFCLIPLQKHKSDSNEAPLLRTYKGCYITSNISIPAIGGMWKRCTLGHDLWESEPLATVGNPTELLTVEHGVEHSEPSTHWKMCSKIALELHVQAGHLQTLGHCSVPHNKHKVETAQASITRWIEKRSHISRLISHERTEFSGPAEMSH